MEYRSLEHKIRDLWIAEANRNTEMRRKVENVGRPKDNVKDETSKLGKQGEIKTKIIDEAADGDEGKVVSDKKKDDSDSKKKPKSADMDDMEAKTIKGGKTEVDTEPKTDDSTENSTDEDKKSKKATNKVNKEIGAKGVKEETMDGKLTFGSSQSLIDSISEAMKKMKGVCSKCGKMPCVCESMKEENIDEKLVGKQHKIDANKNGKIDAQDFKLLKGKKKMEEEAIDEVSAKTMSSYITKASAATTDKTLSDKKVGNRYAGVALADKKMEKMRKEEVESIDELSKGTLASYIGKASTDVHNKAYKAGKKEGSTKKYDVPNITGSIMRQVGIDKAAKKLAKEEVELSASELARIEEIAKTL